MKQEKVPLEFAPTQRFVFSAKGVEKHKKLEEAKLQEWKADFVTIDSINKKELLSEMEGAAARRGVLQGQHWLGTGNLEIKGWVITIARFDGIKSQYSLLTGRGKGVSGPPTLLTYPWVEVPDWPLWEERAIRVPCKYREAADYTLGCPWTLRGQAVHRRSEAGLRIVDGERNAGVAAWRLRRGTAERSFHV